jgi:hypothetical protein
MAKKAAGATAPKAAKGVRVIALQSFTDEKTGEFHGYGHEFEHPKGTALDARLAKKLVRIDDRMTPPTPVAPPATPAAPAEETK